MNRCRHKDKHYLTNFLTSHNTPVQHKPAQLPSQPDHPPDQQHTLPDLEPIQQDNAQLPAQHVHPPDQLLNVHDPEPVPQHIAKLPSHHIHPPDQQLTLHDPGPMELLHHPPDPGTRRSMRRKPEVDYSKYFNEN